MPYKAQPVEGTDDWKVVNTDTGDLKATHKPPDAKEKAERQVRLLEAIENDSGWEEESDG